MILNENIDFCKSCYSDEVGIEAHNLGEYEVKFLIICETCGCRTNLFDEIDDAVYHWNHDTERVFDFNETYFDNEE